MTEKNNLKVTREKTKSKKVEGANFKINNFEQKRKTSFKRVVFGKKEKLAKQARRTKWAPVWVILKKFGPGKRIHPSAITHVKRSWRHGKLNIRPKKMRPLHYG